MGTETLIYGLPAGETRAWCEVLLSTQCQTSQQVDALIARAQLDGWHSFRVVSADLSTAPDFAGTVTV